MVLRHILNARLIWVFEIMSGRINTKIKILDAAEVLFAETGFADTSLRQITSRAEVNLASVNYHFGSKKELIQAVIKRYLDVFVPLITDELKGIMETSEPVNLNTVFESFVQPLLQLNAFRENGTDLFMRLIGRGYTDKQGHLRRFFNTYHGEMLDLIVQAIKKASPQLTKSDIFWRLHFTLGSLVFTMAMSDALTEIAEADFGEEVNIEGIIRRVIPYIASGVAAEL